MHCVHLWKPAKFCGWSARVAVYNLLGQKVAAMMTVGNERVVRMVMPEGTAAGTYFLTVKVGEKVVGKEFKYLR